MLNDKTSSCYFENISQERIRNELENRQISSSPVISFRTGHPSFSAKLYHMNDSGCFAIENGKNLLILQIHGLDLQATVDGEVDDGCLYETLAAGLTSPFLGMVVGSFARPHTEMKEYSYRFYSNGEYVGKVLFSKDEKIYDIDGFASQINRFNDALKSVMDEISNERTLIRSSIINSGFLKNEEEINDLTDNLIGYLNRTGDFDIRDGVLFRYYGNSQTISVPSTVKVIKSNSFNCALDSFKRIVIPSSVMRIEADAFCGLHELESVMLSQGIKEIEKNTFKWCESLNEISIPEGVSIIKESAFEGCEKLTRVQLPNSLRIIENRAFYGCEALREINIPERVEKIGEEAFAWCIRVSSLVLPKSLRIMGKMAFARCASLKTVENESSISTIPQGCFKDCEKLTKALLPECVEYIEEEAFYNTQITEIILGNRVKKIGKHAFPFSLKDIRIPKSVVEIGERGIPKWVEATVSSGSFAEKYCLQNDIKVRRLLEENTYPEDTAIFRRINLANVELDVIVKQKGFQRTETICNYSGRSEFLFVSNEYSAIGDDVTPFLKRNRIVKSIAIDEGVTEINRITDASGNGISIFIPSTVTKIAKDAFENPKDVIMYVCNEYAEEYAKKRGITYVRKVFSSCVSDTINR